MLQIFPLFPYFKALTPTRQNNIMELYVMHTKKQTFHLEVQSAWGAGIAQWLERRTRDWKVAGSNPCRSGGRIFFSWVDFLCWLLFRYPFHSSVTAVARKKIGSILPEVQVAGYS